MQPYEYLDYEMVVVVKNSPAALVALQTQAGIQWAATNTGSFPNIKTGPGVSSFDLKSLLAGCYVSVDNGDALPPATCTLQFTGTKANGALVTKPFTYQTGAKLGVSLTTMNLQLVTFTGSDFNGLTSLSIKPISSASTPLLTGVGIDQMSYVVHTG